MGPQGQIQRLADHVIDRIQSTVIIRSLLDVVIGLLENSLDAEACNVEVKIDLAKSYCCVEDDGSGIHPEAFLAGGGLGCMYHTSKEAADEQAGERGSHGGHGMFLASLSTMSLLSVTSKHAAYHTIGHVALYRGSAVTRQLPRESTVQSLRGTGHGTSICVRNLFGDMPVRIKHHAQRLASSSALQHDWNELNRRVAGLVMAWSRPLNVTLVEVKHSRVKLSTTPLPMGSGGAQQPYSIMSGCTMLLSSRLLPPAFKSSFTPVSGSLGDCRLRGFISNLGSPKCDFQFISLGARPVFPGGGGHDDFYGAINALFDNSGFGNIEADRFDQSAIGISSATVSGQRGKVVTSQRKGIDRWPVFHFQIRLRHGACASSTDLYREHSSVLQLIKAVTRRWLESNGYLRSTANSNDHEPYQPAALRSANSVSAAESKEAQSTAKTSFTDWPRVKSSAGFNKNDAYHFKWPRPVTQSAATARSIDEESSIRARPEENVDRRLAAASHRGSNEEIQGVIHQRGNQLARPSSAPDDRPSPINWLSSVLETWTNPVFTAQTEGTLPTVHNAFEGLNKMKCCNHPGRTATSEVRLSRSCIEAAEVISQIDRKYILLRSPNEADSATCSGTTTLVLVDQHAASERVLLEKLIKVTLESADCANTARSPVDGSATRIRTQQLEKPTRFEVSNAEASLFRARARRFADWGIIYDIVTPHALGNAVHDEEDERRIVVSHVPSTISQRCTQEPRLLIELLREDVYSDGPKQSSAQSPDGGGQGRWPESMKDCPRKLIDMLNSRACRSAVMFNDELSLEECKALIADLAQCLFPFSCAHGRVSMVPLLGIDDDGGAGRALQSGGSFGAWSEDDRVDIKSYIEFSAFKAT